MSLELNWIKLDETLATRLVDVINNLLSTVYRPSFIGPVEVTGIDFGTVLPDIELIDMRDIYRDFLEDDEEDTADSSIHALAKGSEVAGTGTGDVRSMAADEDDRYEWASPRGLHRAFSEESEYYHPHVRYGHGLSSDAPSFIPGMRSLSDAWSHSANPSMSVPDFTHFQPKINPLQSISRKGLVSSLHALRPSSEAPTPAEAPQSGRSADLQPESSSSSGRQAPITLREGDYPDIQLHFRVLWQSDMRISLTTSLVINYPSHGFMSLPIKLSITGFVFNGEVVVAYEGQRRRVHFCIIDDLDPYAPAADRQKKASNEIPSAEHEDGIYTRGGKPLPVGQRLFPAIDIESEIGQTDKHVLKNVTRVERFIQDFIRKTVEDELVFPNFHTILLGD